MKTYKPHTSSFGDVKANVVAALCYVCILMFWVTGIVPVLIIFFVEKRSGLVRFHALQAMLLWLARTLLGGGIAFESMASILTGSAEYIQGYYSWSGPWQIITLRIAVDALVILFAILALSQAANWKDWRIPVFGWVASLICKNCIQPAYVGQAQVPEHCQVDAKTALFNDFSTAYETRGPAVLPILESESEEPYAKQSQETVSHPQEDAPPAKFPALMWYDITQQLPREMQDPPQHPDFVTPVQEVSGAGQTAGFPAGISAHDVRWPQLEPAQLNEKEPVPPLEIRTGWWGQRNKPAAAKLDHSDPNGKLPLDMRDPPPPDMFF